MTNIEHYDRCYHGRFFKITQIDGVILDLRLESYYGDGSGDVIISWIINDERFTQVFTIEQILERFDNGGWYFDKAEERKLKIKQLLYGKV